MSRSRFRETIGELNVLRIKPFEDGRLKYSLVEVEYFLIPIDLKENMTERGKSMEFPTVLGKTSTIETLIYNITIIGGQNP